VTSTVTDGSGHHWPLLARITVAGTTAVTYTSPATGNYSLALPRNSAHTLDIDPLYPGYQQARQEIKTATAGITDNIRVPVATSTCTAPGYKYAYRGKTETFNPSTSLPTGWRATVTPSTATGWAVTVPGPFPDGNYTGGTGNFAWATGVHETASLYTPVTHLTGDPSPVLQFRWYYSGGNGDGTGGVSVDLSTDEGKTWRTIWQDQLGSGSYGTQVVLPLPQAVDKPQVQIRFRYADKTFAGNNGWQLDDIFLGNRACVPSIGGGLVVGTVTNASTGQGITGADVASTSTPQANGTAAQIPGDPGAGTGAYWLFSPLAGSQQFRATAYNYDTQTTSADVTANAVTPLNFSLAAGQLTAQPGSLSATEQLGASATSKLTLTNTGSTPVTLQLAEQPGSFTLTGRASAARSASTSAGWASLPSLPKKVSENLVVTDPATGDVYSFGGLNAQVNPVASSYVYQPGASGWTAVAKLPHPSNFVMGAFVNGKIYIVGGYAQGYETYPVWIYDPATNQWSAGATPPNGGALWGSATVLDGKIYTIGGDSADVDIYDPATNTWHATADYPLHGILFPACGGFNGEIYCAGGLDSDNNETPVSSAFAYNQATGSWSAITPLPIALGDSQHTAANGQLLLSGGIGPKGITSQGYSYTPGKGWTALPNLPHAVEAGGGGCGPGGFYIAGGTGKGYEHQAYAEVLPGYSDCGGSGNDVPWLSVSPSTATLQPGQSLTPTVTLNAADPSVSTVTQPGTYTAQINVEADTPHQLSVPVTMTVTPPKSWGEVTGTVTNASSGAPVHGVTVQICTLNDPATGTCGAGSQTYTVTTSADGSYGLWLDHRDSPVQILATASGYAPRGAIAKITARQVATVNIALRKT
jgi:N-acetylneuraminic acid mutarotase